MDDSGDDRHARLLFVLRVPEQLAYLRHCSACGRRRLPATLSLGKPVTSTTSPLSTMRHGCCQGGGPGRGLFERPLTGTTGTQPDATSSLAEIVVLGPSGQAHAVWGGQCQLLVRLQRQQPSTLGS
jgi:hypothetical protein